MRILVSGTREKLTDKQKEIINEQLTGEGHTLIHGGCSGVDLHCAAIAKEKGWSVIEVKAEWSKYGRAAGPRRNKRMIEEFSPDILYAFPIKTSRGTYDTVRKAEHRGVKTIVTNI